MNLHLVYKISALTLAVVFCAAGAGAQTWGSPNAYGYSTGYGTVYGTFQQAALMQSMYNVARCAQLNCSGRGTASKPPQNNRSGQSTVTPAKPAPPVVRNYGVFRPDPTIDTAKLLADSLGSSAEEKALINQIYAATKASYEKEALAKGWKNNIAGGLTFFTAAAVTIYHDAPEPDTAGIDAQFKAINASIDQIPEFASMPNREKQSFQNMMIGFGGMLLAIYTEGKESGNADTIANAKKLAGMLIEMVLKADPENIRIENNRIVYK
jgi:hypothetical protein